MENRYELLYIIPTSFTDEETGGVETRIAGILTKLGATIETTKRLGKLRLAYAIKDQRHGHYVMVHFKAEGVALAKIEDTLRIQTDILRHMTLRADEAGADEKFELVPFTEVIVEGGRGRKNDKKAVKDVEKEGEKANDEETSEDKSESEDKEALTNDEKAS